MLFEIREPRESWRLSYRRASCYIARVPPDVDMLRINHRYALLCERIRIEDLAMLNNIINDPAG